MNEIRPVRFELQQSRSDGRVCGIAMIIVVACVAPISLAAHAQTVIHINSQYIDGQRERKIMVSMAETKGLSWPGLMVKNDADTGADINDGNMVRSLANQTERASMQLYVHQNAAIPRCAVPYQISVLAFEPQVWHGR